MREYLLNSHTLKYRRRELRKNQTPAEAIIWNAVCNRRLGSHRFTRQYSVGPYILDFFCPATKLCVEIDGESHMSDHTKLYDQEKSVYLEGFGIKIIRFRNADVIADIKKVLDEILATLSCL